MKKIYYLLMATCAILFVCSACSEKEELPDENNLIGVWKGVSYSGYEGSADDREEWNDTARPERMEFYSGHNGQKYQYRNGEEDYNEYFEWHIVGDKLEIIYKDGEPYDKSEFLYDIEVLSSSRLVYSLTETYEAGDDYDAGTCYERWEYEKIR